MGSPEASESGRTARQARPLFFAAGIGTISFVAALNLATRLGQTSDSVQSFVAGYAVAHGNILLSGWNVPLDDYYFTDTMPYAALEWLTGPHPFFLALVPALTYALFVVAALVLCVDGARTRTPEAVAAVIFMFAAPGWIGRWNPLVMSDMHFATVLGALVTLALCADIARRNGRATRKYFGLGAALLSVACATAASDPFSVVFAFGPALVLLASDVLRGARNARASLILLAVGVALGLMLPTVIASSGGFTTEIVTVAGLTHTPVRNAVALFAGLLSLFGANPAGMALSWHALLLHAVRIAALAIAITAVAQVARTLFAPHGAPLLDRLLCAGTLTVLAACLVSAQFGKGIRAETLWTGGPPTRYAMPAALFATVIGARRLVEWLSAIGTPTKEATARNALLIAGALTVLAAGFGTTEAAEPWISENPARSVAHWLAQRGLLRGVGEYWSTNLVSAMSGNDVQVGSVVPEDGRLASYVLAADRNWFARTPQFVIWRDANLTGMTLDDVRATYRICRVTRVEGFRVAILPRGERC